MSNISPIYRSHAIKEIIFALQFKEVFDEESLKKIIQSKNLKSELPRIENINTVPLEFRGNQLLKNETRSPQLAGVEFINFANNEKIDWMLRVHGSFISIHCLDYDGWKKVWHRARQYLEWVVKEIDSSNSLTEIALEYVNVFVYEGLLNEYSLTEILNERAPYLTPKIQTAGPLWHINQGWFDRVERFQARCLNILNINTAMRADNDTLLTQIDHRSQIQFKEGVQRCLSLFASSDKDNYSQLKIDDILGYLHQVNKNIMLELLQPSMAKKVGLIAASEP